MTDTQITLKAARISAGLSTKEVAERLNVSEKTVYNWETGTSEIGAATFMRLCGLYGFAPADIFLPESST